MRKGLENPLQYSVIVLLEDRDEHLLPFIDTLNYVFSTKTSAFEIIVVANGVGGFLRNVLKDLTSCNGTLKAFELANKAPQAVCLKAGFEESSGEIIVVCGSDQQITEGSLLHLLDALDEQTDIVNSWRQERLDSSFNQLQSRIFNSLVRKITDSELHDLSSAVKIFRRPVLEQTDFYGNMYRFLPIIAEQKGFKAKEVECKHYQWKGKTGLCRPSEYIERIVDVFTLYFVTRFRNKPLRFFSLLGTVFLFIGLITNCYVFIDKFFLGHPVGGRPILLVGLFFMVLGIQVASMGLLGEIIAFALGRQKTQYSIEKEI